MCVNIHINGTLFFSLYLCVGLWALLYSLRCWMFHTKSCNKLHFHIVKTKTAYKMIIKLKIITLFSTHASHTIIKWLCSIIGDFKTKHHEITHFRSFVCVNDRDSEFDTYNEILNNDLWINLNFKNFRGKNCWWKIIGVKNVWLYSLYAIDVS